MRHHLVKIISLSLLTISTTAACSAAEGPSNVQIKNVKSGLICTHKIDDTGAYKYDAHVCFETDKIHVTGQGRCVFNNENKLCTWYGFEFEYNNKTDAPIPLTCHFNTNSNDVIGNPDGIKERDETSYEILLEPGHGHFSNPQYTLLDYAAQDATSLNVNRCEVEGQHAFEARFNIIMPLKR